MSIRVVFMGSPDFSVPVLRALADAFQVTGVISQPDKPRGRGRKAAPTAVKAAAIELGRTRKELVVLGLHPGTVDTGLSKPFQSNVSEGKLFTPEQSARYMLGVIDRAGPAASGSVIAWDGQTVPA